MEPSDLPSIPFPPFWVLLLGIALVVVISPVVALVVRKVMRPQVDLPFAQTLEIVGSALLAWMVTALVIAPLLLFLTGLSRVFPSVAGGAPLGILAYWLTFRYLIGRHVPGGTPTGRATIWGVVTALGVQAGLAFLFFAIVSAMFSGHSGL